MSEVEVSSNRAAVHRQLRLSKFPDNLTYCCPFYARLFYATLVFCGCFRVDCFGHYTFLHDVSLNPFFKISLQYFSSSKERSKVVFGTEITCLCSEREKAFVWCKPMDLPGCFHPSSCQRDQPQEGPGS